MYIALERVTQISNPSCRVTYDYFDFFRFPLVWYDVHEKEGLLRALVLRQPGPTGILLSLGARSLARDTQISSSIVHHSSIIRLACSACLC